MGKLLNAVFVCLVLAAAVSGCAGRPSPEIDFVTVTTENRSLSLISYPAGEPLFFEIAARPDRGFMYEFYLFVPGNLRSGAGPVRLLVEPNNTGTVSDSHSFHARRARQLISCGTSRELAERLSTPLLVPAFDRPETGWERYTHALDRDTMKISRGDLRRIDLQLIAMIEEAGDLLGAGGIVTEERVFLNGYSASGNFVNRFTALHPQLVRAAAAGGINGMPILPVGALEGRALPFHVGVADLKDYTDGNFDLGSYRSVAQFYYMGELDDNDTLPYDDAYSEEERRLTAEVLGDTMAERWLNSQAVFRSLDLPVIFATYAGIGHQITPETLDDVTRFFRENRGDTPALPEPRGETVAGMKQ